MDKNKLLMAVAAVALIAGTSGALAQQEPPRSAPPEKMAPKTPDAPKAVPSGGATHNGEADTNRKNAEERGDKTKSNRVGEGQPGGRPETTGQAPQERKGVTEEKKVDGKASKGGTEEKKVDEKASKGATEQKKLDGKASEERGSGRDDERNRATTGQATAPAKGPNANLSVNITPENRTRIHEVFVKERSAPKVDHVTFNLSVGTAVPRSVHIVAVPQTIIEIQPTWRGYEYFMVGDQIVIVDPRSMQIVAVLDA
jgi:hypothetical protein